MKVYNLSQEQFQNLKQLKVTNTPHKDGDLFYMPSPDNGKALLFKKFFDFDQDKFLNRICTVINLHSQKQDVALSSLAYPEALITIDGMLSGYVRPFIKGTSLKELLVNPDMPFKVKKESLIKVGKILENMQYIRQHSNHPDFYLNDIHEGNFLYEHATGEMKAIDLDSSFIRQNYVSPSMYLHPASRLTIYKDKYFLEKYNPIYAKQIVPTQNTEIYCYAIMLLNYLYGDTVAYMPADMLQNYLYYLRTLDYNSDLLMAFSKLYSPEDNINPVNFLEDFHEDPRTNFNYYRRVLRTNHGR